MDLVVAGQADGHISVWNTDYMMRLDNISPDPDWVKEDGSDSLVGWANRFSHHSGAILSVRLSPNHHYLASGSSDHTCKLWVISSYKKDIEQVMNEMKETENHYKRLNGYIDVLDESYNEQLENKEFTSLRIGEIPLAIGYHADLKYTFQHEAPVLSVRFTTDSKYWI